MSSARRVLTVLLAFFTSISLVGLARAALLWTGLYGIGADEPHTKIVETALERLRDRSVTRRARALDVPPDLDDSKRVAAGASHYAEMCVACHLAPGVAQSELRDGLYPRPPSFMEPGEREPRAMFWTIKHGIKMSAMPAWGKSHDDETIWNMVAFVRKVPGMSVANYHALTGQAATRVEMAPTHGHEAQAGAPQKPKPHGHHHHRD